MRERIRKKALVCSVSPEEIDANRNLFLTASSIDLNRFFK